MVLIRGSIPLFFLLHFGLFTLQNSVLYLYRDTSWTLRYAFMHSGLYIYIYNDSLGFMATPTCTYIYIDGNLVLTGGRGYDSDRICWIRKFHSPVQSEIIVFVWSPFRCMLRPKIDWWLINGLDFQWPLDKWFYPSLCLRVVHWNNTVKSLWYVTGREEFYGNRAVLFVSGYFNNILYAATIWWT